MYSTIAYIYEEHNAKNEILCYMYTELISTTLVVLPSKALAFWHMYMQIVQCVLLPRNSIIKKIAGHLYMHACVHVVFSS